MLELSFSGAGTQGYSSAKYASEISVTIYNPNQTKIEYIKISFYACVSNSGSAGTSKINYYLNDLYIDSSSLSLTSSSSDLVKTLYVPSSISSSTYLTLTFGLESYTSGYPPVFWSISHSDSGGTTTPTEYEYTIYYYKDGSYYTKDSEKSTSTSVKMSLISLPSTTNTVNTSSNFTITGDKNGGVSNTSLKATKTTYKKTTWNGWYKGSSGNSGTKHSGQQTISADAYFNAVSTITYPVEYANNTLAQLSKPTKASSTSTYTVTFEPNSGTVNPTSKQATKTIPYKFSHWSNSASGGTTYAETQDFTSAETVYAQWSEDTNNITTGSITLPTPSRNPSSTSRTVTFNANGGSCNTTSLASTNTTTYSFKNWKDPSGNTYNAGASYTPSKSITLAAQWNSSSTGYNVITLPEATRTGYNFSGWYDQSAGKVYTARQQITPTDDMSLTALWSASTYEVKYNGNGHTGGSMENSIHTIGQSSNLSDNEYIKEYILSFDSIHIENSGNNNNNNDNINNSLLPSGFIQLDYIQANYNQFLNTEYNFTTNNVKIYLEYKNLNTDSIMAYNGNLAICGAEDTIPSDGTYDMCGGILFTNGSATNYRLNVGNAAAPLTNINIPRDEKLTIEINCSSEGTRRSTYSIFINGVKQQSLTADSHFKNKYEYYIFGYNLSGTPKWLSAGNLYRCTMYDDDLINPVRDFIPCKRISDNAIGVYDLVEARFYQSGSGVAFVAGNEIENDEPEIDVEDEIITYDGIKVAYTHNGWYSDASCSGSPITSAYNLTSAGNVYDVYAGWTQNNYVLPIPEKEGYTFLGWYDSQGNLITNNSLITSNLFLTAQWVESSKNKIIIYTDNSWKKAITLIYKNNTWQEYNFNIK